MTTPPCRLVPKLQILATAPSVTIDIRSVKGDIEERVTPMQAIAYAIRGTVEGVGPSSGAIRYLRKLPPSAMPSAQDESAPEAVYTSSSSVVAQTHMGVYRQEVESSAMNDWGMPTRVVIGHVYAFCGMRGL